MYQVTKRITDRRVAVVLSGPDGTLEAAAVLRDSCYTVTAWPGELMTTEPKLATRGTMHDAAAELERDLWRKAIAELEPRERGLLFTGTA